MHRIYAPTLGFAIALSVSACGPADKPAPVPQRAAKVPAGEVAREARGEVACPPKIGSSPRAKDAAVDDVVGVRPGLTYEEAMGIVLCSDPLLVASPAVGRGFDLKAPQANAVRQGFSARPAEERVAKSGRQIVQEMQRETIGRGGNALREDLKPGQAKWFVGTMGLPGQERVVSVAREERLAADHSPTVESVLAALRQKYGQPTEDRPASENRLPVLRWAYDPLGRLVAGTSPLVGRCVGSSDPDGALHVTPDCGLVVQAILIPLKSNPDLVDRIQVGAVDHAATYGLVSSVEQGLGQIDQRRRAQEVEKAGKSAKGPTL